LAGEGQARRLDHARPRHQPQDGPPGQRLAGARLADDAEALAAEREADAPHRLERAGRPREGDVQVRELEQRLAHGCLGSSTSRSPSPSRLKPRLTTKMAMPGMVETHHWSRMYSRPEEIIAPHSGIGGCAPRPRKPSPAAVMMMPAMSRVSRTITD